MQVSMASNILTIMRTNSHLNAIMMLSLILSLRLEPQSVDCRFLKSAKVLERTNIHGQLTAVSSEWIQPEEKKSNRVTKRDVNSASSPSNKLNSITSQRSQRVRCPSGAPIQWQPYLDAASKAHLAPMVALASLKHLNLTPIQLATSSSRRQQYQQLVVPQQQLSYHAQNVNNIGVNIEATFIITSVLKRIADQMTMNLRELQTIKLYYKVSASLSTTSALMTLANSNNNNNAESTGENLNKQNNNDNYQPPLNAHCALDLSEHELVKKVDKIFKLNQKYVLFLDQATTTTTIPATVNNRQRGQYYTINNNNNNTIPKHKQQVVVEQRHQHLRPITPVELHEGSSLMRTTTTTTTTSTHLYPFATHEPLTNQTSRALRKILCENCAQVPQIELVNSTFVSIPAQQQQPATSNNNSASLSHGATKIKLDCKVTGYPTPWIEWFRNGKLLRNKVGSQMVKVKQWKKRHNVRLSRLELNFQSGKDETGIYECRAMNVVAREPVVGSYTLLVFPALNQYALIPFQTPSLSSSSSSNNNNNNNSIATNTNSELQDSASFKQQPASKQSEQSKSPTGPATVTATTITAPTNSSPANAAQQNKLAQQAQDPAAEPRQTSTSSGIESAANPSDASKSATTASASSNKPTQAPSSSSAGSSQAPSSRESVGNKRETKTKPQQSGTNGGSGGGGIGSDGITSNVGQTNTNSAKQAQPAPVVGHPCPREAQDNFCLNKGTCVLIVHIEEYFCNCAEGYHGHRSPATFEQKFVVIQAKLGDAVRLECNASGDQPITIEWYRENSSSSDNNNSNATHTSIEKHGNDLYDIHELPSEFGLASFMQIRSAKPEDGLLYKCLAKNDFGTSERLLKLIVVGVPERPQQLRVRDIWSRSALITWQSHGGSINSPSSSTTSGSRNDVLGGVAQSGSGRISNYTVQYWRKSLGVQQQFGASLTQQQNHRREELQVDGLHSSALLANLLPAITYEVSVIAHNQVGHSEPSEPINVTTSEEEPSAPPTDVQVESRGSSSLRVMWKVPPVESLNGKLLGFYIGYRPRASSVQLHSNSLVMFGGNGAPLAPINLPSSHPGGAGSVQQQQQSVIYSFKTADAIEGQLFYDTFLTNLKHNQDYEIIVRAFNKAGSGPDCHTLMARTNSPKLPQGPNLQVQKVTTNSVTLKWTSTVMINSLAAASIARQQQQMPTFSALTLQQQQSSGVYLPQHQHMMMGFEILRFVLYYQLQGDRDWYEITVPLINSNNPQTTSTNSLELMDNKQSTGLVESSSSAGATNGELITSQASIHTLSNLQPGANYRIYVSAANDYGIGDPSNVVSVRTTPLDSLLANNSAANFLGAALLDSVSANSQVDGSRAGGFLDSIWPQHQHQQHQLYTLLSSFMLVTTLLFLVGYIVWQHKLRHKYNSSSGSSYPSSWTPAASDTIQSEYSVKRFPFMHHNNHQATGSTLAMSSAHKNNNPNNTNVQHDLVYDEVCGSQQLMAPTNRAANITRQTNSNHQHHQLHNLSRNGNAATNLSRHHQTATSQRPLLSSHYHQPADLISSSNTLQLQSSNSFGSQRTNNSNNLARKNHASSTLNKNQNRQLPPIPYSTLTVKEIDRELDQASVSVKQQWRQQQNSQPQPNNNNPDYRICNQQQQQQQHLNNLYSNKPHLLQSTGGSQTPLIYGVIE